MKYKYFTFFLIILLFSCNEVSRNGNTQSFEIKTAILSSDEEPIENYVDSVWYVPLETTEASVLAPFNDYVLADTSIIILSNNELFRFNDKGKYHCKIEQHGQGPEDLGFINDIVWNDERKELYAWDGMNAKLLVYDECLNLKKIFPFRTSGVLLSKGNFLYIAKSRDDFLKKGTEYALESFDLQSGELKKLVKSRIPPISPTERSMFSLNNRIYEYNGNIYLNEYLSDTIWRILPNSTDLTFAYHLNIGEIQPAHLDYPSNSEQGEIADKYIRIGMLYETDNHLFITVRYLKEFYSLACSKKDGSVILLASSANNNCYDGGTPINRLIPLKGNVSCNIIWPEDLLQNDFIHRVEQTDVTNIKSQKNLLDLIDTLEEDDNPVLRYIKIKE